MGNPIRFRLEYTCVMSVIGLLNLLPFTVACAAASKIGNLWYFIDKKRRDIALNNLRRAYRGEKSEAEILKIARGSFINLCMTIIEMCCVYASKGDWIENLVECRGLENVREARKRGKGLLFFTAHLGNWELGALRYGKDSPINFIARELDNKLLEKEAVRIRTMYGNNIIYKKGAIKTVLRCIKEDRTVAMLIDQNTVREEGVFVNFFGIPACTTPVLAILALKTGAPVIPVFDLREDIGRHKLVFGKEVEIKRSGDKSRDIRDNTLLLTKIIESYVRRYPDQWLWMHRRWKTQP